MTSFRPHRLAAGALLALAAAVHAAGAGPGEAPAGPAAASSAAPPASALPALRSAPAPTRAALETLLSVLPEAGPADAAPRQRVVARRGDTVDAVIRRSLDHLPFKEAFLRGVFLELNAGALQPGTTRLQPGAELVLPTVADLRAHLQRLLGPLPGPAHAAAGGHGSGSPAPAGADRRHWPRYP